MRRWRGKAERRLGISRDATPGTDNVLDQTPRLRESTAVRGKPTGNPPLEKDWRTGVCGIRYDLQCVWLGCRVQSLREEVARSTGIAGDFPTSAGRFPSGCPANPGRYATGMDPVHNVTDTSPEALQVQLEGFRRMTPQERFDRMCRWSQEIRDMARNAIRRRHPDWSEDEVRLKFIELTYGAELAREVRQFLKERNSE